jgi:tetratricopeptide (TPR) repeat protein
MPQAQQRSPIQGNIAFTGRLGSMKRAEAFALVREHGGTPRRGVSKSTDQLVVGQLGWPLLADGRPSNSLARAQAYGVAIVSERRFLEWIGRGAADEEQRSYTAEQIASVSGLPVGVIGELAAFGVLDPRDGRYRFRDLAAARQVAELFAAGVTLSVITTSLHAIERWLPDAGLARLKLYPAAGDAVLVEQLKGRTDHRGQFVLPIEEMADNPDALFEEAQAAEEAHELAQAEKLYRRVMKLDPEDPAAAFNLGNLLRAAGRKVDAEKAYRVSIKTDPRFIEALYNLADLLDDQGRTKEAIGLLRKALDVNPAHADCLFNMAVLMQRLEDHREAADYWRRYLMVDASSEWAARAKRSLKLCEMQIKRSS